VEKAAPTCSVYFSIFLPPLCTLVQRKEESQVRTGTREYYYYYHNTAAAAAESIRPGSVAAAAAAHLSLSLFREPVCCCGFLSPALTTRMAAAAAADAMLHLALTPMFTNKSMHLARASPHQRSPHLIPPRRALLLHTASHTERAINAPKKEKERGHLSHLCSSFSLYCLLWRCCSLDFSA
jgi:hypothetical protein